jgi:hypothetical protein
MAIAIKKDAVFSRYKDLVLRFIAEDRTGIKLTCPEGSCGQEYLVYFHDVGEEPEVRMLFDSRVQQHHPSHLDLYALDEPVPGCEDSLAIAPNASAESEIRRKMRLNPRLAVSDGRLVATDPANLLTAASRVAAGCVAFVVAAVPLATRPQSLMSLWKLQGR